MLTVVQLLFINLAMDTLAAIAFGSEPALEEYMKEKPIPRSASIVSKSMLIEIIISALYITLICIGIRFVPFIGNLFGDVDMTYLKSALFATFMMAITFNGFNARTSHINPFEGIGRVFVFIYLFFVSVFLIISIGITRKASAMQINQLIGERASTLSTFPPNVTNINCNIKIEIMTVRKFLLIRKTLTKNK